ncbi:MAG: 1-acyl-sn-glycerol-3-phosphate acyltransferase [Deltaproteobacteria bacterium]|nr:1-acyl-sn-glycerol-3-phosphate acyltransferase [Deltaproteobacteria bacterium]
MDDEPNPEKKPPLTEHEKTHVGSREVHLVEPQSAVVGATPLTVDPLKSPDEDVPVEIPKLPPSEPTEAPPQSSTRESLEAPDPERPPNLRARDMHRWGFLGWVLGKLFFSKVFFPKEAADRIREAAAEGTVVYVMRIRSTLSFLYFNHALLAQGLPIAHFANGLRTLLWQPIRLLLRQLFGPRTPEPVETLKELTNNKQSSAIFLRSHAVFPTPNFEGPYLRTLLELQKQTTRPIILVPLTVLWGFHKVRNAPGRFNLLQPILGNQDEPRPLRRWFQIFRYAHRSLAVVCQPLRLDRFLAEREDDQDANKAADSLETEMMTRIEAERRVRIGPRRAHFLQIRKRILDRPEVETLIHQRATEQGKSVQRIKAQASKTLKKMQAQMSTRGLRRLKWIVDQFWKRIFQGFEVDETGLAKLPEVGRRGPLVFLPTHRSHVDYLVLSDLLVSRQQTPPHIAAGANLSFWPMGWIFRTAGAFFLRRRYQGDLLYSALLRAYVAELLTEGHYMEIFIEGGRTRTGKLLAPKLGLLSVVADLAASGEVPPVHVVPVSIGYERTVELKSVTRELTGGRKQPESIGSILRAAAVLRSGRGYGFVNIQFGEPIDVREFLVKRGYEGREDEPEVRRNAIRALGYHSLDRASKVSSITPTSLCATAMLAPATRGVPRSLLKQAAQLFSVVAKSSGARFSNALWPSPDQVFDDQQLDHAIELLAGDDCIAVMGNADERIYVSEDQARVRLDYQKNLMIQHLLGPALIAIVLRAIQSRSQGPVALSSLQSGARFVASLLRLHFIFEAGRRTPGLIDEWIERMATLELIDVDSGAGVVTVDKRCAASLELLASVLESTVEAYSACARSLLSLKGGSRRRPELEQELLDKLHRRHLTGTLRRFESCQVPLVKTVIDWLCDEGILQQTSDNGDLKVSLARQHADGDALARLVERTEQLLVSR